LQLNSPPDKASRVVYKTAALPVRAVHTRQLWSSGSARLRAVVLRLTRATHSQRYLQNDKNGSSSPPGVSLLTSFTLTVITHTLELPL
jgi:hypothetical protein